MIPHRSTPVPNEVFDYYLRILKPAELKVLLVIIRQTIGWVVITNRKTRKTEDWISHSQLTKKTGYSRKAIGVAIEALTQRNLIIVTNVLRKRLYTPAERQGQSRLYYAFNLNNTPKLSPLSTSHTYELSSQDMCTFFTEQKKLLQKKYTMR